MGLGHNDPWVESHMWSQRVKGHLRVNDLFSSFFCKKRSVYPHTLMYFHGTWTQWSLGSVTHKTSTDVGQRSSRGWWPLLQVFCKKSHCIHILWCIFMGLGHSDPWVESHIRPQQMWGQRSSRGQWSLVQVFAKTVTVSTYFDVCSGKTRGSRTTLYFQAKFSSKFKDKNNIFRNNAE